MKKQLKGLIAIAAAATMSLASLATIGCSNHDNDPKYITFWYWGSPAEVNVYEQLIAQYQKEHPDITIGSQHYESNTYMDKFLAETKKPDVFFMPDTDFLQWVDAGIMLNLDSYVTEAELNSVWDAAIDEYYYNPETKTLGKSAGAHFYGFPKDLGPNTLVYNKTLLDQQITKNNLDRDAVYELLSPTDPMTWNEFRQLLKDLTKDQVKKDSKGKPNPDQIYGIPYFEMDIALYCNNACYFTDNAEKQGIDQNFIDSVAFNIQLATVDEVMPAASISSGTDAYTRFFNSKSIFTWAGPWDNADFWNKVKFGYDVVPAPYNGDNPNAQSVTMVGSMCYGISAAMAKKNPEKAQTAVDFAKWLCMGTTCQQKTMELGQQVPNLKSMKEAFVSADWNVEPAHRSLYIDILDGNTNSLGLYESAEQDKITGKTRPLYYTYNGLWKDNLMSYINDEKLWECSDKATIQEKLEAYKSDLQLDLDDMNAEWKRK